MQTSIVHIHHYLVAMIKHDSLLAIRFNDGTKPWMPIPAGPLLLLATVTDSNRSAHSDAPDRPSLPVKKGAGGKLGPPMVKITSRWSLCGTAGTDCRYA